MIVVVMHKHITAVLVSTTGNTLEVQWSLQWRQFSLCRCHCPTLAVCRTQELHGMVISRNGKTWQIVHHLAAKRLDIPTLQILDFRRILVVVGCGGNIGVKLEELVLVVFHIHQPFCISKQGNGVGGTTCPQSFQFGNRLVQFGRPTCIQHHHIGFGGAESLGESLFAGVEVGDIARDAFLLQAASKSECKDTFVTGTVVTVNNHGVAVGKT